jgi:multidrug resistance efflux pump
VRRAEARLREREVRVRVAQAEVRVAQKTVTAREAAVEVAKADLAFRQRQFDRLKRLYENKVIDEGTLKENDVQVQVARGRLTAAETDLESARAVAEVKKARVALAEAALGTPAADLELTKLDLESARVALEGTRIVSPLDGVVTRRELFPGDFVRSSETDRPTPLVTVERIDRLRVVVFVPDQDAPLVEPGAPVELSFDGLPGTRLKAAVARVAGAVDPKTRFLRVEIDLDNSQRKLRPGMYGTATIQLHKAP